MDIIKRLIHEEEGQGMAEYALVLILIAVACIAGYTILGQALNNKVSSMPAAF